MINSDKTESNLIQNNNNYLVKSMYSGIKTWKFIGSE